MSSRRQRRLTQIRAERVPDPNHPRQLRLRRQQEKEQYLADLKELVTLFQEAKLKFDIDIELELVLKVKDI